MKTLIEIQEEQHAWSLKNFGPHGMQDPADGIVEEVGELHHAVLKARQGIRGTPEELEKKEKDALADIVIYVLDLISVAGYKADQDKLGKQVNMLLNNLNAVTGFKPSPLNIEVALTYLRTQMVNHASMVAVRVFDERPGPVFSACESLVATLILYAQLKGWDLLQILNETWEQVSQRDWTKKEGT